jgi:hypothetical protein
MVSPCDFTINHKQTTSHGAQDISQCIMESYIQLTPLNNYLSNCVIKLPMKLLTPNLPLSNCVIKLHIKLHAPYIWGMPQPWGYGFFFPPQFFEVVGVAIIRRGP